MDRTPRNTLTSVSMSSTKYVLPFELLRAGRTEIALMKRLLVIPNAFQHYYLSAPTHSLLLRTAYVHEKKEFSRKAVSTSVG